MRITVTAYDYPSGAMGGAEYQTALIAHGLADVGHTVTFLGTAAGTEAAFGSGAVAVRRLPGWRRVGAARHREALATAIRAAAPDLCYVRSFWDLAALSAICRPLGVPLVSISCHVLETGPFWLESRSPLALRHLATRQNLMHLRSFLAISQSAAHLCNTRDLEQRVTRWFPRQTIRTIYNGSPAPPEAEMHHGSSGQVIFVNNLKRWKRPEAFIELARRLPRYRFLMVGRMAEGRYGRQLRATIDRAPANVHYLGPQPIDQVNALIAKSDLLLYTSLPLEGFGNSFMQAWFRGVPTISLEYALDGIIERERVGRCARSFEQLVSDVEELMGDEALRAELGRNARRYATAHHSVEALITAYDQLFCALHNAAPAERAR